MISSFPASAAAAALVSVVSAPLTSVQAAASSPTAAPADLPHFEFRGRHIGDDALAPAYYVLFYVSDQKIAGAEFLVSVNLHDQTRNMLIGKYGPPAVETTGTVQNLNGANFDDVITNWRFNEGNLVLHKRSSHVDQSIVQFVSPSVARAIAKNKTDDEAAKGKAVF